MGNDSPPGFSGIARPGDADVANGDFNSLFSSSTTVKSGQGFKSVLDRTNNSGGSWFLESASLAVDDSFTNSLISIVAVRVGSNDDDWAAYINPPENFVTADPAPEVLDGERLVIFTSNHSGSDVDVRGNVNIRLER